MKNKVKIDVYTWNERELAQIIRRKMITKSSKNKKKYNRNNDKRSFKKETSLFCIKNLKKLSIITI